MGRPRKKSENDSLQIDPKKYHFSGSVQDGDKEYFVGWYINQKIGKGDLGKMKTINIERTQSAPRKPVIDETKNKNTPVNKAQDVLGHYP